MIRRLPIAFAVALFWAISFCAQAGTKIYFSPKGGCTAAIVKELDRAKKTVRVNAYSFTSEPIEKALEAAKKRGVDCQVILDSSWQNESPKVEAELVAAGIPVWIDAKHAIAHSKVIVIDSGMLGGTVITGSFNFTNQAEFMNWENLLIIKSAGVASLYFANWQMHVAHCYDPANPPAKPKPKPSPTPLIDVPTASPSPTPVSSPVASLEVRG